MRSVTTLTARGQTAGLDHAGGAARAAGDELLVTSRRLPRGAGGRLGARGRVETDFLNGGIVLLGALHGVATPTHRLVQRVANELARAGKPPGSVTPEELRKELAG